MPLVTRRATPRREQSRAGVDAFSDEAVLRRRHRPDYILLLLAVALLSVGLIVIYSIGPGLSIQRGVSENYYINKQLIAISLGLLSFAAMAMIPFSFWKKMRWPLVGAAVLATLFALAMPVSELYPAHRWIRFGGLSFQSVELIKYATLFILAAFLVQQTRAGELHDEKKTFRPIIIAIVVVGFIIARFQSDLGSTAVLFAMVGAMCFVAGLPLKRVMLFGGILVLGLVLAISTSAYRRDRLLTFMHPERDCQTTGYQACQALIAVGSGGLFGKGLGQSVQAYGYLPEAANDSIFAIYAEKFGFVGSAVLVGLFMAFFTRLKNIIERAPDLYTRLLVTGVLAWLSTQTIINIGAMIGLLPLKGITLPFISYGGTSIIFVTALVGLVFHISRYTTYVATIDGDERNSHDNSTVGRRDRRTYNAYSGNRSRT